MHTLLWPLYSLPSTLVVSRKIEVVCICESSAVEGCHELVHAGASYTYTAVAGCPPQCSATAKSRPDLAALLSSSITPLDTRVNSLTAYL